MKPATTLLAALLLSTAIIPSALAQQRNSGSGAGSLNCTGCSLNTIPVVNPGGTAFTNSPITVSGGAILTTGATLTTTTLSGVTTLPGSGQISAAGWIGIGGIPASQLQLQGNISSAAWTTGGVALRISGTHTDTSSSGTVADAADSAFGAPSIAASNATTFTRYSTLRIGAPAAGANVTITNPINLLLNTSSAGIPTLIALDNSGNFAVDRGVGVAFNIPAGSAASVIGAKVVAAGDNATNQAAYLAVYTRDTSAVLAERMRLTNAGNLGIGTIAPAALLSIGTTAATAYTSNLATDATNWDRGYLCDWGVLSNTCTYGTAKSGTGIGRNVQIISAGGSVTVAAASFGVLGEDREGVPAARSAAGCQAMMKGFNTGTDVARPRKEHSL